MCSYRFIGRLSHDEADDRMVYVPAGLSHPELGHLPNLVRVQRVIHVYVTLTKHGRCLHFMRSCAIVSFVKIAL